MAEHKHISANSRVCQQREIWSKVKKKLLCQDSWHNLPVTKFWGLHCGLFLQYLSVLSHQKPLTKSTFLARTVILGDTIVFEGTLRVMTINTTLLVLKPSYFGHFGAKPTYWV